MGDNHDVLDRRLTALSMDATWPVMRAWDEVEESAEGER